MLDAVVDFLLAEPPPLFRPSAEPTPTWPDPATAAAEDGDRAAAAAAGGDSGAEGQGQQQGSGPRVLLNVYDLLPPSGISEVLWLGGLGLHHSAVEVYGTEYSFGGHEFSFPGVFAGTPREAAGATCAPRPCHARTPGRVTAA